MIDVDQNMKLIGIKILTYTVWKTDQDVPTGTIPEPSGIMQRNTYIHLLCQECDWRKPGWSRETERKNDSDKHRSWDR